MGESPCWFESSRAHKIISEYEPPFDATRQALKNSIDVQQAVCYSHVKLVFDTEKNAP